MARKLFRLLSPGRLIAPIAIVGVTLACAPAADAAVNTWAGVWNSDFGRMTLDAGGSGSYEGFNPGTLSGNVTGNVNQGTWNQPGNPPKGGTFKFTLSPGGLSFTGEWAYDAGGCGTACGWNGTCIEGPCLKNGAATKKKPKKRKKRIGGCPAARTSSTNARAATTCHWVVDFKVSQKGVPVESRPPPGVGFFDSETTALGKVFFNAKPKAGRISTGRAAGVLVHTDTYQSSTNPFLFPEGEVKVTPLTARYKQRPGEIQFKVTGVVTSVARPVYSQHPNGHSTEVGDRGGFAGTFDFPLHRDDVLETSFGCNACTSDPFGDLGFHYHRYIVDSDNKLRVTISRPKHLAGRCDCKA